MVSIPFPGFAKFQAGMVQGGNAISRFQSRFQDSLSFKSSGATLPRGFENVSIPFPGFAKFQVADTQPKQ